MNNLGLLAIEGSPLKTIVRFVGKNLYWLVPVVASFCFSVFFHFRILENQATFVSDSGGYLLSATNLWRAAEELFACHFDACWQLLSDKECSSRLLVDGPVLPLWGATMFALAGKLPAANQWPVIVVAVASMNATIAGLLSVLLSQGLQSKTFGLIGGSIWAFYPGAVFASGLYLSEPLVTFVIMISTAICCFISIAADNKLRSILVAVQGLIAGIGFLLKPALIPLFVFLAYAPQLVNESRLTKKIQGLFLGSIFFTAGPLTWALYTKLSTGHAYFCPQRVPLLNIAVGHDLETDAWWCATPGSKNLQAIMELGNSFAVLLFSWTQHPVEILELYFRKVPRIVGFVWNDYKQPIFQLGLNEQNFLHALLVGFAVYGALIFCFQFNSIRKSSPFFLSLLSAALFSICCHVLMYLPFMANSRYGYPAMPGFVILAVFGISSIVRHSSCYPSLVAMLTCVTLQCFNLVAILSDWMGLQAGSFWTAWIRVLALCITFFLSYRFASRLTFEGSTRVKAAQCFSGFAAFALLIVLPSYFCSNRVDEARECSIELAPDASLYRTLTLPQSLDLTGSPTRCFVVVDSDQGSDYLSLRINGKSIVSDSFAPISSRDTSLVTNVYSCRMLSYVTDIPIKDFRQWRIVEIPKAVLKTNTANCIEVRAQSRGVKIYADKVSSKENKVRLPSLSLHSFGKAYLARPEIEPRLLAPVAHNLDAVDWSVSAPFAGRNKKSPDRIVPRLFLLIAKAGNADLLSLSRPGSPCSLMSPALLPATESKESIELLVDPSLFDPSMHRPGGNADELWINRYVLQLAKSTGLSITLPAWCASSDCLEIKVSGAVRAIGHGHAAGILLGAAGPNVDSNTGILAASAPYIHANKDWTTFTITDYANARSINSIFLSLFPGRPEQIMRYGLDYRSGDFLFKNIKLSVRQRPSIDLSSCEVELF